VKALIKIGGTLLDASPSRLRLAAEIARAVNDGLDAVIVHGGGKQLTRYLAERGVESRFVGGLRVTNAETLDAVLKVLAGSVNQELVAALVASVANAVGLTGMDALLTEAAQLSPELGSVGKPVHARAGLLDLLLEHDYLPVVACLAGDRQGRFFNVNADQMAASLAQTLRADRLFFLTDVDGVRSSDQSVRPIITLDEARNLIENGVATGGMQAKLNAAAEAILNGVGEVVIAPGCAEGVIGKLLTGGQIGTRLVRDADRRHP